MSTVVNAPAVVSTLRDVSLRAIAMNVVQPNLSSTATVAVTNESSAVPVCRVVTPQMIVSETTDNSNAIKTYESTTD